MKEIVLLLCLIFVWSACEQDTTNTEANLYISFQGNPIKEDNNNFHLNLPHGSTLNALSILCTTSPKSSLDHNDNPISLEDNQATLSVDFTEKKTHNFTVISEDKSKTKRYTITATILPSNKKSITSFLFSTQDNKALTKEIVSTINQQNFRINVAVPYGTSIASLIPTIQHSGEKIQPQNNVSADFSNTVTYQVTSESGSHQTYEVYVTVESLATTYEEVIRTKTIDIINYQDPFYDTKGNLVKTKGERLAYQTLLPETSERISHLSFAYKLNIALYSRHGKGMFIGNSGGATQFTFSFGVIDTFFLNDNAYLTFKIDKENSYIWSMANDKVLAISTSDAGQQLQRATQTEYQQSNYWGYRFYNDPNNNVDNPVAMVGVLKLDDYGEHLYTLQVTLKIFLHQSKSDEGTLLKSQTHKGNLYMNVQPGEHYTAYSDYIREVLEEQKMPKYTSP